VEDWKRVAHALCLGFLQPVVPIALFGGLSALLFDPEGELRPRRALTFLAVAAVGVIVPAVLVGGGLLGLGRLSLAHATAARAPDLSHPERSSPTPSSASRGERGQRPSARRPTPADDDRSARRRCFVMGCARCWRFDSPPPFRQRHPMRRLLTSRALGVVCACCLAMSLASCGASAHPLGPVLVAGAITPRGGLAPSAGGAHPGEPGAERDEPSTAASASAWRPAVPPARQAPWRFRIAMPNGDGTTGAYLEVDEDGLVYNYLAGQPRPARSNFRIDDDYSLRDVSTGRVTFYLRPADGELIDVDSMVPSGSRPAQDLHCHLTQAAELACVHDDQSPFTVSVGDGHLVGRAGGQSVVMHAFEPAATSDEQRRRVLFLYALYAVPADTGSHDGDSGFFDGP
jgi:hypothetical protein